MIIVVDVMPRFLVRQVAQRIFVVGSDAPPAMARIASSRQAVTGNRSKLRRFC